MEEGIPVRGIGHQILSRELYQETIILSDMFELNEFLALDLLCTAQIQLSYYPGLPRGLVAVLLYYEAQKSLLASLRMLVQARTGVAWSIKISDKTERFITAYTDQLMENGLFARIFELLRTLDLTKEIEKLQENVALGGPKHRRQVTDLFKSIRLILADIVFLWSMHCGLTKSVTLDLIDLMKEVKLEEEPNGMLDNVNLYLQMALLCATSLSVLHTREDGEEVVQKLPILSESDFISSLIQALQPEKSKWACEGLQGTTLFGFAVCLSSLRLVPQGQQLQHAIEQEDSFIDAAIGMKVFEFFIHVILENELVQKEDIIFKQLHSLFTDFIVHMYSKVKELRIKADETARTIQVYAHEGLEPPQNLPRHFENLLFAISKLYSKDPLNLQLILDYWAPMGNNLVQNKSYRTPSRSITLFKFLRLAGEMLPSTLFVPYLHLLSSLSGCPQAARHCFNMLKQTGSGLTGPITWDHFFMSFNQYYNNLRQEAPPANDTVYRHRSIYHKGITPQEIEGLHSVLLLLRVIAEQDDFSRLALCEHPGWAPLSVLLGLVSCSVPIPLKAELLLTLAALSKSPETAVQMWNNLEASQILVTIPSTSSYQPRGIQTELDEIESSMEQYPLTTSLLVLLDELTNSGIPRTLGAGPRKPGFDPYLTFIINSVFLKFNARSYKDPAERWHVASLCLKLFEKFLNHYEPDVSDFPNTNKLNEFNSPPGFHLMLQMNSKSEFLNMIFFIIDEGNRLYDLCIPILGQKYIEESTFYCLNIIDRCLMLQTKFFALLGTSGCPILLAHLNKLLLTINPRSGKPDHVLNIAKYVSYQFITTKHSLVAVKILINVTNSPATHSQLMNILLSSNNTDKEILNGFVECLDEVIDEECPDLYIATKEMIFVLLKQCLPYNAPNLSHFLFGFDLKKDISQTVFQLPGIMNFPRTCIHSLLGLLRSSLLKKTVSKSTLLEYAYQMLYSLCANYSTSEPVLRLLRLQTNFFKDHIHSCLINANKGISELNQLSWLLKVIAIELRVSCRSKQIYYLKQLTALLMGLPSTDTSPQIDEFSLLTNRGRSDETKTRLSTFRGPKENLLISLIAQFDFEIKNIDTPQWEFFDNTMLENLLSNCQTETSPKFIDVKKLHQILLDELSGLQGSAAIGQRQSILQEIHKVLEYAINVNNTRKKACAITRFVNSWRQIVEVLSTFLPHGILSPQEQQILGIEILENLLPKIVKIVLLPEVANLLSGAVLLILENLRRCQIRAEKQKKAQTDTTFEVSENVLKVHTLSLKVILNNLIEWILTSDVSSQKLRINLYGCLVTFLNLINVQQNNDDLQIEDSFYVSRLDNYRHRVQHEKLSPLHISADVFASFGQKLIESLCNDGTSGQDVCKMLAMAAFSLLVNLSGNVSWISYMSGKGFLKHMIQSILDSNKDLRLVLEPVPTNLRPLYIYESKMSLLCRLATIKVGAELLLEQGLLSCLSSMKVFDYHPDILKQSQLMNDPIELEFITPVETRYLQLWLPSLDICNGLLTSLGSENQSAVTQVMHYLISHLDVVELILRAGSPSLSATSLKELSIITAVLARTANNDLIAILENCDVPQDNRAYIYRIQKLMLALLSRFVLCENVVRELLISEDNVITTYQTSNRLLYTLKIITNLLMYARNTIANNNIDHTAVGIIFPPTLSDSLSGCNGKIYRNINDYTPSLGVIVQQLLNIVTYYHKEKITYEFLKRKINDIPTMNSVDLKEFITLPQQIYDLNILKENALELVSEKLQKKKLEIDYCSFSIEHCMYLIWTHLDYYMLKAIPRVTNHGLLNRSASFNLDSKY